MNLRSSHELYLVLNHDGTLYVEKNKDYRLYKTKKGLEEYKEKYAGKKVAVFQLTDVIGIEELLMK